MLGFSAIASSPIAKPVNVRTFPVTASTGVATAVADAVIVDKNISLSVSSVVARTKRIYRALAVPASTVVVVRSFTNRTIQLSVTMAAGLSKAMVRSYTIVSLMIVEEGALVIKGITLSLTTTVAFTKAALLLRGITVHVAPQWLKSVARGVAVNSRLDVQKGLLVTLSKTIGINSSVSRQLRVWKPIDNSLSTTLSAHKNIGVRQHIAAITQTALIRGVFKSRSLNLSVSLRSTLMPILQFRLPISSNFSFSVNIGKRVQMVSAPALVLVKALAVTLKPIRSVILPHVFKNVQKLPWDLHLSTLVSFKKRILKVNNVLMSTAISLRKRIRARKSIEELITVGLIKAVLARRSIKSISAATATKLTQRSMAIVAHSATRLRKNVAVRASALVQTAVEQSHVHILWFMVQASSSVTIGKAVGRGLQITARTTTVLRTWYQPLLGRVVAFISQPRMYLRIRAVSVDTESGQITAQVTITTSSAHVEISNVD